MEAAKPIVVGGRWTVQGLLGRGEMGIVYRAFDLHTSQLAAVKVVDNADSRPDVRSRLKTECAVLAQLISPHVARLLDSGEDDAFIYIAYELVEGQTITELLPLELPAALTVALCVADALADAHQLGFIHRDLKPSNVIIPFSNGHPLFESAKLLDFGVAGLLDVRHHGQITTTTGQVFGTPYYMAPEQLQGQRQTFATDVYGVGALLYAMIYGRAPFQGAGGFTSTLLTTLTESPRFPEAPSIPRVVRSFLERCLAKDPAQRPKDGLAARAELEHLVTDARAIKRGRPRLTRVRPSELASTPWWRRRLREFLSSAALCALIISVGVCIVVDSIAAGTPRRSAVVVALAAGLAASWGMAWLVHRWIEAKRIPLGNTVTTLLGRANAISDLTKSLALDVGKLVEACRQLDHQILAKTLALMIGEYDKANASADRQAALMRAVDLMEKLQTRLAPWYVRYQSLLSWGIGLIGTALSAAKTLRDLWSIAKR
jgi:hypothetical protein